MTTIDPRYNVPTVIAESNRRSNDYEVFGRTRDPTFPPVLFGQQYKFDVREARKLTAAIEQHGWFTDPMLQTAPAMDLRGELLKGIYALQIQERARQAQGGIKLTRNAAKQLNAYAQKLGVDLRFGHNQPSPIHPVG